MKKIFLSLSAIALLSTAVVSCGGSDDSTAPSPGPDPIEGNGILSVNNEEFVLDTTESYIYGVKNDKGENVVRAYRIPVQGDTLTVTRWTIDSFDGEDVNSAENYQTIEVYVPVNGNSVVAPHESENLYLAGAYVMAGGKQVNLGTLSQWGMEINTFVEEDGGGEINYTSGLVGSTATVNVEFNGPLNGTYFYIPNTAAKGTKQVKNRTQKIDVSKVVLEKGKAELIRK